MRRRSVMSLWVATEPPPGIGWWPTSMIRPSDRAADRGRGTDLVGAERQAGDRLAAELTQRYEAATGGPPAYVGGGGYYGGGYGYRSGVPHYRGHPLAGW